MTIETQTELDNTISKICKLIGEVIDKNDPTDAVTYLPGLITSLAELVRELK